MSVMGTPAAYLRALTGADTVNKDESYLVMGTTGPGDVGPKERLRISEVGLT